MACYGIHGDYIIVDCGCCDGTGHLYVIRDHLPPSKDTCEICGGTGVVKIPIDRIKVLGGL